MSTTDHTITLREAIEQATEITAGVHFEGWHPVRVSKRAARALLDDLGDTKCDTYGECLNPDDMSCWFWNGETATLCLG